MTARLVLEPEIRVSREAARRFLIRRGLLQRCPGDEPAPAGTGGALHVVRRLEYVQVDPMLVLERSHDLVLAARVEDYRPGILDTLLYRERKLVEVLARNRLIVPVEDYPLFSVRFADTERENRSRVAELEPVMERVLRRIEAEGPLSSLDFEDKATLSGWWDADGQARTRVVRQALEWLWYFGRLVISHREGSRRYFDLPERVLGPEVLGGNAGSAAGRAGSPRGDSAVGGAARDRTAAERELRDALALKYFRAMGLADPRDWSLGWSRYTAPEKKDLIARLAAAGEIVPVAVEGVKTTYLVPASEVDDLVRAARWEPEPGVRLLPPLDNLIWLRKRTAEIFGFDYTWEAYVPAAKRKYGPYTCPILYGDRLVGRIDARVEREGRPRGEWTLVVNGLWWEESVERPGSSAFERALREWARANGADRIEGPLAASREGPTAGGWCQTRGGRNRPSRPPGRGTRPASSAAASSEVQR